MTLYFASLLEYAYWAGGWRLAPASSTGPPLLLPASRDLPLVDRSSLYLDALLAGLVSSADTGSEDLIVAARRALAYFCTGDVLMLSAGGSGPDYAERPWSLLWRRPSSSPSTSKQMGETTPTAGKQLPAGDDAGARINHIRAATLARSLLVNLSGRDDGVVQGLAGATDPSAAAEKDPPRSRPDRIVIPTLEVLAYLLRAGLLPLDDGTNASPAVAATAVNPSDQAPLPLVNLKKLCLAVQRAGYKTGSLRKLEACVHVYGAVAFLSRATAADAGVENENLVAGGREARRRLATLLSHPWPHVRSLVVDELWVAMEGEMLQDEDGKYGQCGGTGERCEKRSLLLGVDWGTAKRDVIKDLVRRLGLE